jgi:hypothetical protein
MKMYVEHEKVFRLIIISYRHMALLNNDENVVMPTGAYVKRVLPNRHPFGVSR